jgi:glycine cleavage system protein P-like pyridoxal-binding family
MAGFKVVSVACLKDGDIDLADFARKQTNTRAISPR